MSADPELYTAPRTRTNGGRLKQTLLARGVSRLSSVSRRSLLLMVIAVLSGSLVAVGIFQHLTRPRAAAPPSLPALRVVTTAADVERGTVLADAHLRLDPWPHAAVPEGVFQDLGAVVGRTARTRIPAGQPVLESLLLRIGAEVPLAVSVPGGYRAVGIAVDPRGGIHHWLAPGDRVDVIVTVESVYGTSAARVLLQNIEVLVPPKIDPTQPREVSRQEGVPVTVSVTPADAEKLALGMRLGTLQLLVRHPTDAQAAATSGVTSDTLLPEGGVEAATPTYRIVEVINGRERTQQRFHAASGLLMTSSPSELPRTDAVAPEAPAGASE